MKEFENSFLSNFSFAKINYPDVLHHLFFGIYLFWTKNTLNFSGRFGFLLCCVGSTHPIPTKTFRFLGIVFVFRYFLGVVSPSHRIDCYWLRHMVFGYWSHRKKLASPVLRSWRWSLNFPPTSLLPTLSVNLARNPLTDVDMLAQQLPSLTPDLRNLALVLSGTRVSTPGTQTLTCARLVCFSCVFLRFFMCFLFMFFLLPGLGPSVFLPHTSISYHILIPKHQPISWLAQHPLTHIIYLLHLECLSRHCLQLLWLCFWLTGSSNFEN